MSCVLGILASGEEVGRIYAAAESGVNFVDAMAGVLGDGIRPAMEERAEVSFLTQDSYGGLPLQERIYGSAVAFEKTRHK